MANSAFFGQPPSTSDDYFIVRALLRSAGLDNIDPNIGSKIPPARPPPDQYQFETRGPGIIAGLSVCIVVMSVVTGSRLVFRWCGASVRFGWDDWLIIPGAVGCSHRAVY